MIEWLAQSTPQLSDARVADPALLVWTIIIGLIFTFFALVPLVPGLRELREPVDDSPLAIDSRYSRDPRFFGKSFRGRVLPLLEDRPVRLPAIETIKLREEEQLEIHDRLTIPPQTMSDTMFAAYDAAIIGEGALVGDIYSAGEIRMGEGCQFRTAACEGVLSLGPRTLVLRWVDAEAGIVAGEECDLGTSATSGGPIFLGEQTVFHRLWGMPIVAGHPQTTTPRETDIRWDQDLAMTRSEVKHAAEAVDTPKNLRHVKYCVDEQNYWSKGDIEIQERSIIPRNVISHRNVTIGDDCVIIGTVKSHGILRLGNNVRIVGNLVARGNIFIGENCAIRGVVFSERDLHVGPKTLIGQKRAYKSTYSNGATYLYEHCMIYGWVMAEAGGMVVHTTEPTPLDEKVTPAESEFKWEDYF